MATSKVIVKLLKFKGLIVVDLALKRDNELHIAVKPFKNGCQCPRCGRRGKIVRIRPEVRWWRDIRFWNYNARWAAERFLKGWMTAVRKSRLEPMKKFVKTVEQHYDGILAFIDTGLTNAIAEGLNRTVKIVKNRASGFHTLDPFADMIYLTTGDVDIPAQIPSNFVQYEHT